MRRIKLIFINVILTAVLFELIIFLIGLYNPIAINHVDVPIKGTKPVILVLGESTSTDYKINTSWPAELQAMLDSNNFPYEVVNLAVAGVNSSFFRKRIEKYLNYYDPEIILMMLGANDLNYWLSDSLTFIDSLAVTKFFKALKLTYAHYQESSVYEGMNSDEVERFMKAHQDVLSSRNIDKIRKAISTYNGNQNILKGEIASRFVPFDLDTNNPDFYISYELYKEVLSDPKNYQKRFFRDQLFNLALLNMHDECLDLLKILYKKTVFLVDDSMLIAASICGRSNPDDVEVLLSRNTFTDKIKYNKNMTRDNLDIILNKIGNRKAYFVQYPLTTLGHLPQDILKKHQTLKIIENYSNFKKELEHKTYDDLFIDRFTGGAFGHFSDQGAQLVGKQVFEILSRNKSIER